METRILDIKDKRAAALAVQLDGSASDYNARIVAAAVDLIVAGHCDYEYISSGARGTVWRTPAGETVAVEFSE
jgi:pentose-5-phosphate-3-epimerase